MDIKRFVDIQVNLDMTDSMGPGKLVRHMQNPSYTYDEHLICIRLGPSISSVIRKNLSYHGPSYPSSPVLESVQAHCNDIGNCNARRVLIDTFLCLWCSLVDTLWQQRL